MDRSPGRNSAGPRPQTRIVRPEDVLLGVERRALRPSRLAQVVGWFTGVSAAALLALLVFWLLVATVGGR